MPCLRRRRGARRALHRPPLHQSLLPGAAAGAASPLCRPGGRSTSTGWGSRRCSS
ncbi:MAG: hypothetical protein M3Y62_02430 [Candidatus Dormibacteraeota bacterium]|nr:hypothetical protein [Candidatus Dormibacteraeota bacterium]